MAHYAFIDTNGLVVGVIPGRGENEIVDGITDWEAYYATKRDGLACKRTSYNTYGGVHYTDGEPSEDQTKALRFNYAGIGYTFDPDKGTDGAFIPPKPYDSWVLDEDTCLWVAPVPMPEETDADGNPVPYVWDEDAGNWVAVPNE